MDERNSFLQEILANPDDDIPRLIYADWLEEQGDPRGEFIRLQCELSSLPGLPHDWPHLTERVQELLVEHQEEWADEFGQDVRYLSFNRGFIDTVTLTANQFLKRGGKLLNAAPIEWLRLTHLQAKFELLKKSPLLERIRGFDFGKLSISTEDLAKLLKSPHLTNLRRLDIQYANQMLTKIGAVLAKAKFAPLLQELHLRGSELDEEFFKGLGSGDAFPELQHFGFGGGMSRTRPMKFKNLHFPKLKSLDVGGQLRVVDCEELCHLPLDQLKHLDLSKTKLPAKGMKVLAESGVFQSVEALCLDRCNLSEKAGVALLNDNDLSNCQNLSLVDNDRLGTNFIHSLVNSDRLGSLMALDLSNIPLEADALMLLAEQENMPNLKILRVYNSSASTQAEDLLQARYQSGLNIFTPKLKLFINWR